MKVLKQLACIALCATGFVGTGFANSDLSRVWIEFSPAGAENAKAALLKAGAEIHYRFDNLNAFAASVPTVALRGLERNPNITLIEEDAKRYPSSQQVPYGIDSVQARDVWDSDRNANIDVGAPTGSGRMICVIDSGLKTDHEDFAGVNIVGGYPTGWNTDTCGHGTHVAGTMVSANNDKGVVGVTPGAASLYVVKVFDGADCGWTYSSDLVNAAKRCEAAGANIISMSLGGAVRSRTEQKGFDQLYSAGLLSIAAAGNDGNTTNSYPASYNSVISVAAVDASNNVADFSQKNSAVELAAPGVGVLSTVPWSAVDTITVDGNTYIGGHFENAAHGSASGALVNGGLCENSGIWNDKVVLCERGNITFYDKVLNVQNGGGVAVVIYNNSAGEFSGTLGSAGSTIPAISLSQVDGQLLLTYADTQANVTSSFTANASGYEAWDGTSMATPHVSAVAALVWSFNPALSNAEIRNALTASALDLGAPGRDNAYGYGLVQAHAAWLNAGGGNNGGDSNQTPLASFNKTCSDLSCSFDASDSSDTDGSIASYDWDFGDGNTATHSVSTANHTYSSTGNYSVTLKVTDDQGATGNTSQSISVSNTGGSGDDTAAPIISNVSASKVKGTQFKIQWTTDELSSSVVAFTCCGTYGDNALVTSHSVLFRGTKGVLYTYTISSTDAAGNTRSAGPFNFQN